jgi:hypothetical protein
MQGEPPVLLNQGTVLAVGGILTTLCGAIGILFRAVMAAMASQLSAEREAHAATRADRDYWRELALSKMTPQERARKPQPAATEGR